MKMPKREQGRLTPAPGGKDPRRSVVTSSWAMRRELHLQTVTSKQYGRVEAWSEDVGACQ